MELGGIGVELICTVVRACVCVCTHVLVHVRLYVHVSRVFISMIDSSPGAAS